MKPKYIHACLSPKDFVFFRFGGPGLANCLLTAARAYVLSRDLGCAMLRPTWERIGLGQWLRREKDKRFYVSLFRQGRFLDNARKFIIIKWLKERVCFVSGLGNFFGDLVCRYDEVKEWFYSVIDPTAIKNVPEDMHYSVAIHVRLGDYPAHFLTDMRWYKNVLSDLISKVPKGTDIQLFSDGSDEELSELLQFPGVRRVFYGNALADIVAISRCGFIIGSDSTFSGWGAFLGQVPCVYSHLHYSNGGIMLKDETMVSILGKDTEVPIKLLRRLV